VVLCLVSSIFPSRTRNCPSLFVLRVEAGAFAHMIGARLSIRERFISASGVRRPRVKGIPKVIRAVALHGARESSLANMPTPRGNLAFWKQPSRNERQRAAARDCDVF